jgi:hypothetical protein
VCVRACGNGSVRGERLIGLPLQINVCKNSKTLLRACVRLQKKRIRTAHLGVKQSRQIYAICEGTETAESDQRIW